MNGPIVITLDQLRRPQPAGIGTYIRGLVRGFSELALEHTGVTSLEGLTPRGPALDPLSELGIPIHTTPFGERITTQIWRRYAMGVPSGTSVLHATTMAGPFRGGRPGAVHSVAIQDVLWRDHPELTTTRGAAFHEQRLQQIRIDDSIRVIVTSNELRNRLVADGFDAPRIHVVRLGAEPVSTTTEVLERAELLERLDVHGCIPANGNYTLAVGTIQPRKNLERLVAAHQRAAKIAPDLGPLLVAGARGWGDVDLTGAVELGEVSEVMLTSLVKNSRVCAYVPIDEGWGLPPVEALRAGRPVLVSRTVPSVESNPLVVSIDPNDEDAIMNGLIDVVSLDDSPASREVRRDSVSELTWASCVKDHLAAWS